MDVVEQVRRRVTFTDLQQMPDDGRRYELYDGEVWEMPSPTLQHQRTLVLTMELVRDYERKVGGCAVIAPFDIVFSEYDVAQPDAVYFVPDRLHVLSASLPTRARPDLAVEVLSPGTTRNDRVRKLDMFARYGVPEYWIVDPAAGTVELLSLAGGHYDVSKYRGDERVTSLLLPDLTFIASTLFEQR